MTPFATANDLEAYWKALEAGEEDRATVLLTSASNQLRLKARPRDLDQEASEDTLLKDVLKTVVLEATKRAMTTPIDAPPATDYSQTAGPYSENIKFFNPAGDLFFKKAELKLLGIGGQVASSWTTTKSKFY